MRDVVITANWKMYKTSAEATQFLKELEVGSVTSKVYIAPPFTAIESCVAVAKELKLKVTIGAQNMHDASEGAFTGEIAGNMLKSAGAEFVILGHSERRILFKESSEWINKKIKRALAVGLQPVLCIGETKSERDEGLTERVLEKQLEASLEGLSSQDCTKLMLAYEPVWAIGTGVHAKPQDAQKAHHFCRTWIKEKWGQVPAERLVIQYGGSVTSENAAELMQEADIDGLLVGGASRSASEFSKIIKNGS